MGREAHVRSCTCAVRVFRPHPIPPSPPFARASALIPYRRRCVTGAAAKTGPPLSYAELAKAAANKNGAGGASAAPAPAPAPAAATAEAGRAADAVEKPAASAPKADRETTAEGDAKSAPAAADAATKDTGSPKVRPLSLLRRAARE